MILSLSLSLSKQIRCAICRADIIALKGTYQSSKFYGVICPKCAQKFSADDIELMAYLFFLYGGYYGKFEQGSFSITQSIKTISEQEGKDIDQNFLEINQRLMHDALLHGISPQELNKKLQSLLDH